MEQIPGRFNWLAVARGQRIPVEEFARMDETLRQGLEEIGGAAGDMYASPNTATELTPLGIQCIWIRITAFHAAATPLLARYSAEQVWQQGSTFLHNESSNTLVEILHEANGRTDVTAGTIALAWPTESIDARDRPIWRFIAPGGGGGIELKHGKLDGAMAYLGSAVMSAWNFTAGAEADTGENVTVYDWLLVTGQSIAAATQVVAASMGGRWYVIGAQCGGAGGGGMTGEI